MSLIGSLVGLILGIPVGLIAGLLICLAITVFSDAFGFKGFRNSDTAAHQVLAISMIVTCILGFLIGAVEE